MLTKLLFFLICSFAFCDPIGLFTPPEGWECVESVDLPKTIQVGFRKKGKGAIQPSLNLAKERITVSLKEYLTTARRRHEEDLKVEWRDLGDFVCRGGKGRLIELRDVLPGGELRMLQAILIQDGWVYVLTGAMRKEDFSSEQKEILQSLRSLFAVPDLFAAIEDRKKRTVLEEILGIKNEDQKLVWHQYVKALFNYQDLGSYWLLLAVKEGRSRIFLE